MESDNVYKKSYDEVQKAIKANLTGKVTIDYSKFDDTTASTIRLALSRALGKRKTELWDTISGTNKT